MAGLLKFYPKFGLFLALAKSLLTQRGFILWGGGNYFSFNFIPFCFETSFILIGNSFLLIFIFCYAYISFGNYFALLGNSFILGH